MYVVLMTMHHWLSLHDVRSCATMTNKLDMQALQSVKQLKDQARSHVLNSSREMPEDVAQDLTNLWQHTEDSIDKLLKDPNFCQFLSGVSGRTNETSIILFIALGNVNDRLAAAEDNIKGLNQMLDDALQAQCASETRASEVTQELDAARQRLAELDSLLQQYQLSASAYMSQTAKLVLRQAAYLVTNKLVRRCLKNKDGTQLTPAEACFMNLNNLMNCKFTDKAELNQFLQKHKGLETGLNLLANTFVEVAHLCQLPPNLLAVSDADCSVVSMEYLRACLDEECPANKFPMREELDMVLDSLQELSTSLGEPLFVSTKKPEATASAASVHGS